MRRIEHLRAQLYMKPVQAMRRGGHQAVSTTAELAVVSNTVARASVSTTAKEERASNEGDELLRAQPHKKSVQSMWWGEYLSAQLQKKRLQGIRRVQHLPAQPHKKQVQGMSTEGGLVLAITYTSRIVLNCRDRPNVMISNKDHTIYSDFFIWKGNVGERYWTRYTLTLPSPCEEF